MITRTPRRSLGLAAIAATTLALSGCGAAGTGGSGYEAADPYASDGGASSAPAAAGASAGSSSAAAEPAAKGGAPALKAKEIAPLGKVLTDAQGFVLYRFDKDTAKPTPTTACVADCATKWPPLVVDPKGTLDLDGVEKGVVGMVARPDGGAQLTVGGWPVYRFGGDKVAGSTGGQGVGGTWFAVTPEGKKAAAA